MSPAAIITPCAGDMNRLYSPQRCCASTFTQACERHLWHQWACWSLQHLVFGNQLMRGVRPGRAHRAGAVLPGGPHVGHKKQVAALALLQEVCDLHHTRACDILYDASTQATEKLVSG